MATHSSDAGVGGGEFAGEARRFGGHADIAPMDSVLDHIFHHRTEPGFLVCYFCSERGV